jgi:16S rRNA U1498 N3-methylase RsmE
VYRKHKDDEIMLVCFQTCYIQLKSDEKEALQSLHWMDRIIAAFQQSGVRVPSDVTPYAADAKDIDDVIVKKAL